MNKMFFCTLFFILSSLPLQAVEKETVVLREWNNGRNTEYLEFTKKNRRGDLVIYTIWSVYGDMQKTDEKVSYDTSINKYIMNCKDGLYRLNKTYFLKSEEFVTFKKYDDLYYSEKPLLGWEKVSTNDMQEKVSGILCK